MVLLLFGLACLERGISEPVLAQYPPPSAILETYQRSVRNPLSAYEIAQRWPRQPGFDGAAELAVVCASYEGMTPLYASLFSRKEQHSRDIF